LAQAESTPPQPTTNDIETISRLAVGSGSAVRVDLALALGLVRQLLDGKQLAQLVRRTHLGLLGGRVNATAGVGLFAPVLPSI
jgi:hypothetical protein